ncbi:MAG: amino acid permease, partial [Candidatus Spechtbacteria bacterium]|nr:amino acid permease [Candidatus Spechtbacteria bacterium]
MLESNRDFKQILGLWVTVFALGIGSLIGGGLFGLTGFAVGYSGPSFLLVIILLALLNFPTVMAYTELGLSIPDTGGGYAWIKMAFGNDWGHLAGWASWGAHTVACAVYALNIGYFAAAILSNYLLPHFGIDSVWGGFIPLIASGFVAMLTIINLMGASRSGAFGMYLVLALLLVLGVYIGLGIASIFTDIGGTKKNFDELLPQGPWGFITAMGIFSLAFQGSEIVAQAVKEIKDPKKNLKRALFFSYAIITVLYVGIAIAAIAGTHGGAGSSQILADAGEGALAKSASFFLWGSVLIVAMLGAGFMASLAALNSTIFSSSHAAVALARAKSIPREMGILNNRGAPKIAIPLSAIGMIFMIVVLPLQDIAAVANLLFIFLFLWVNLALIKIRLNRPEIIRPYKVPFFPWLNVLAAIGYVVVAIPLFSVSSWGVTIVTLWFVAGLLTWFLFAKKNIEEEIDSAIVYEAFSPLGPQTYAKVFCPLRKETNWKVLLRIACAIARSRNTGVYVCLLQELPLGVTSLQEFKTLTTEKRDMIRSAKEFYEEVIREVQSFADPVSIRFSSAAISDVPPSIEQMERFGHAQIILKIAQKIDADVLLMPFEHVEVLKRGFVWQVLARVLRQIQCHIMIVKVRSQGAILRESMSCLVPYVINPHANLLRNTALALGTVTGQLANLKFIHAEEPRRKEKAARKVREELGALRSFGELEIARNISDIAGWIIEKSEGYDLLLLAAHRDRSFTELEFGDVAERVLERSEVTTIVVH